MREAWNRAALLPDEPLRRVICSQWSLLQQIPKFPKVQGDAESQAEKAQEMLKLFVFEAEQ